MRGMLSDALGNLAFQLYKKGSGNYILECNTMLDSSKKVLCFYFCDRLPENLKKHWSFYYYHPAFMGTLTIGGITFRESDFNIIPSINDKAHKMDLQILQTSKLAGLSNEDRGVVVYMMLNDYLGELTADAYVGQITFGKKSGFLHSDNKNTLSMDSFRIFLNHMIQSKGWVRPHKIRLIADSFMIENKETGFRKDITSGVSYNLDILNEEDKPHEERVETIYVTECGVRYYSLVLPRRGRDSEECKKEEVNWEKRIYAVFADTHSGTVVTSAFGNTNSYIDFFAYDEESCLKLRAQAEKAEPPLEIVDLASDKQ
jgi:hypothetical protein